MKNFLIFYVGKNGGDSDGGILNGSGIADNAQLDKYNKIKASGRARKPPYILIPNLSNPHYSPAGKSRISPCSV